MPDGANVLKMIWQDALGAHRCAALPVAQLTGLGVADSPGALVGTSGAAAESIDDGVADGASTSARAECALRALPDPSPSPMLLPWDPRAGLCFARLARDEPKLPHSALCARAALRRVAEALSAEQVRLYKRAWIGRALARLVHARLAGENADTDGLARSPRRAYGFESPSRRTAPSTQLNHRWRTHAPIRAPLRTFTPPTSSRTRGTSNTAHKSGCAKRARRSRA